MKAITVKNLVIGEGAPKIIVSLMGKDIATVRSEALACRKTNFDILEWRVDHFTDVSSTEAVLKVARIVCDVMADKPLLFIFRSAKEDDEQALFVERYVTLNHATVGSGLVDIIGLKLFTGNELVRTTVEYAHAKNVFVIMSNHDFHKTSATEEIVQHLRKMQELGAGTPEIALMPQSKMDVLILLSTTLEMQERYANRPIITMSIAKTGAVSRLSGEIFGSAATFEAVKKASTPGQISVIGLRTVLTILHQAQLQIYPYEYQ